MDTVLETRPGLAPHCALGSVGSDPVGAQVLCEESAPLSQCGFPDVETLPVLAHRLDDQVHMRMILVRMHGEGIAMLEGELLPCEVPAREQQLLGRGPLRHREDDVMNEPGRLATRLAAVRPPAPRIIDPCITNILSEA